MKKFGVAVIAIACFVAFGCKGDNSASDAAPDQAAAKAPSVNAGVPLQPETLVGK
jgi:hypothetical protein